jgi:hypothetical protein
VADLRAAAAGVAAVLQPRLSAAGTPWP